jgi:hypothetical protein
MDSMALVVEEALAKLEMDKHVDDIVGKVKSANLFLKAHKPSATMRYNLGSEYHRLKYIEEKMPFIAPVPVVFNPDAPRSQRRVGQYVPIKATLEQILNDATYQEQLCSLGAECECISGIFSGACYKSNSYFRENPAAVPILLYSDGLCITNPLNANAAKKNKLIGVYMTLGSVAVWNRSRVDPTQLVMVVNEKDFKRFGPEIVFKQLIDDLKG